MADDGDWSDWLEDRPPAETIQVNEEVIIRPETADVNDEHDETSVEENGQDSEMQEQFEEEEEDFEFLAESLQEELRAEKAISQWLREELDQARTKNISLQQEVGRLKKRMARLQQTLTRSQREAKKECRDLQKQCSQASSETMDAMRLEEKAHRAAENSLKEKNSACEAMRKAQAESERLQSLQASPFLKIEYETESGGWASYPADSIDKIWEALSAGKPEFQFNRGDETYRISLPDLKQKNTRTNKERKIRIALDVPQRWSISACSKMQHFRGCLTSGTDAEISGRQTVTVKRAWRIENPDLFRKYRHCRANLQEKCQSEVHNIDPPIGPDLFLLAKDLLDPNMPTSLNEVLLFHGTQASNIQSIVAHGFDFRLAREGYYGQGTYFASQTCKSWQYCRDGASRYMIVARVFLGKPSYANKVEKDRKLPPKGHDSIIANPGRMPGHHQGFQSHQEFVIFDRYQAYPEFLLEMR